MIAGRETSSGLPRILVAEHDQSVAELLFTLLQGEGYELSVVSSLASALERLNEKTFHLVLTDLFVEHVKRSFVPVRRLLRRASPTPVGLLTGWPVSAEAAKHVGFAFLLPKPFDLDLLLTEIAACLDQTLTPEQEQQLHTLERFVEALTTRNREALLPLLTEDCTYYPSSRAVASSVTRIKGRAALFTYVVETLNSYPHVSFDEFTFHPRPRGWAMRYTSHWPTSDGSRPSLTGALLFHFRGEHIHQIGNQWNDRRLQALMDQQQDW